MNSGKLKTTLAALAGIFISVSLSGQTVTLLTQTANFGAGPSPDDGTAPAGGVYAFVVDTSGDGFFAGQYGPMQALNSNQDASPPGSRPDFALTLEDGSDVSNWVGYVGPIGSDGNIAGALGLRHGQEPMNVSTGDQFGLLWFPNLSDGEAPSVGDRYGFYTNENLTIPSAGDTTPYGDFITNDFKGADYTIVPEPSTYAAIFGFGVLLFVFLRRRFKK